MAETKFEDALKNLEAIVDSLESGSLNLDEAIKKYEEGMKLSSFCYKRLGEIQKRIEMLVKDPSGSLKAKDFNAAGLDAQESNSEKPTHKTPAKKRRPRGEELLF